MKTYILIFYLSSCQAKAKGAPVVEEPQEVHSSVGVGRGKSADRRIDIQVGYIMILMTRL